MDEKEDIINTQINFLTQFFRRFKEDKVEPEPTWLHKSVNMETGEVRYSVS